MRENYFDRSLRLLVVGVGVVFRATSNYFILLLLLLLVNICLLLFRFLLTDRRRCRCCHRSRSSRRHSGGHSNEDKYCHSVGCWSPPKRTGQGRAEFFLSLVCLIPNRFFSFLSFFSLTAIATVNDHRRPPRPLRDDPITPFP